MPKATTEEAKENIIEDLNQGLDERFIDELNELMSTVRDNPQMAGLRFAVFMESWLEREELKIVENSHHGDDARKEAI